MKGRKIHDLLEKLEPVSLVTERGRLAWNRNRTPHGHCWMLKMMMPINDGDWRNTETTKEMLKDQIQTAKTRVVNTATLCWTYYYY